MLRTVVAVLVILFVTQGAFAEKPTNGLREYNPDLLWSKTSLEFGYTTSAGGEKADDLSWLLRDTDIEFEHYGRGLGWREFTAQFCVAISQRTTLTLNCRYELMNLEHAEYHEFLDLENATIGVREVWDKQKLSETRIGGTVKFYF